VKQLKLPFVPDRGKHLHRQGSMERVLASAKANVPRVKKSQPKLDKLEVVKYTMLNILHVA
jgi:hypothetical protein